VLVEGTDRFNDCAVELWKGVSLIKQGGISIYLVLGVDGYVTRYDTSSRVRCLWAGNDMKDMKAIRVARIHTFNYELHLVLHIP